MKTAIVIINYNGLNLIKKFMPSIITNSSNFNIYVIDNNIPIIIDNLPDYYSL